MRVVRTLLADPPGLFLSTDTHRLVRAPAAHRDAARGRTPAADGQESGEGKTGPCVEAGVERYTTYRLGGMRDPPSAQSGSDKQIFGAVGQVRRSGCGD